MNQKEDGTDQRHRTEANLRRVRRYLRIQTQCGVLEAVGQSWRVERRLAEEIWLHHEELSNKHSLIFPPGRHDDIEGFSRSIDTGSDLVSLYITQAGLELTADCTSSCM